MLHILYSAKKFFPNQYVKTIYDIDFNKLYDEGKKYILTDLDNTLIPYTENLPNDKLREFKSELEKIGYKIIIVSNSKEYRVKPFCEDFGVPYVKYAKKPMKSGYKKAMKKLGCKNKNEIIFLGDQLSTDVLGANRAKLYNIVVDSISIKDPKWYTKIAKNFERKMKNKMKRKHSDLYTTLKMDEKI